MQDPLHRLFRVKLVLLATLLFFVGLALLIFARWAQHRTGWSWVGDIPLADIGTGMFTTGLLGVAWQYVDGRDSEARDSERLKRVLAESAPAMRDAVIDGFAFEPDDLARVATDETLDQIITNGLAIRLGDAGFARDVYEDVRQQAIGVPERLHNARISIHLSPLPANANNNKNPAPMFVATVRWEAELHPKYRTRRFTCTSDMAEFREITHDTAANSGWYVSQRSGLDASAPATFEVLDFTVDGQPRRPRRGSKQGVSQSYSFDIGDEALENPDRLTIAYTYRTLVPVNDHLLRLRVDQPTKALAVELDYSEVKQMHMTVLDFVAGPKRAQVTRTNAAAPQRAVRVEYAGWVFPGSGAAFVWV